MVGIAVMAEVVGLTTAIFASVGGPGSLNLARAIAYGCGALLTFLIMDRFLRRRGVTPDEVWVWKGGTQLQDFAPKGELRWTIICGIGIFAGAILGLVAVAYLHLVLQFPAIEELIRQHPELAMNSTQYFWAFALLAIGFAPLAEEYLSAACFTARSIESGAAVARSQAAPRSSRFTIRRCRGCPLDCLGC